MKDAVLGGFEGASFVVTHVEATKRFWVDYLGGTIVAEGSDDGARPCQVLLGGVILEFYRALPGEAPAPGGPNEQHYSWDIEAGEFDLWAARAQEWGMRPLRVTAHAAIHGLSIFFDDPDGYHMELAAHYVNAADMDVAHKARAELIQALAAIPGGAQPAGQGRPPTEVGLMSHFTNSAPDLAAATHFWIDFLGGELYTVGPAISQLVLAGITIDLFAPNPRRGPTPPGPGSVRQHYRFRIARDQLEPWIDRAAQWGVRMSMLSQEELLRLTLVVYGAEEYHVGLVARYRSVDELRADADKYRGRVARLDTIRAPFTAETGLATAAAG